MKSRRLSKQIALIGLILFGSAASAMNSAIQTDNTLSGITAFSSELSGNQHLFTLSEAQGQIAGSNLFYSFSQFNIGSGDTAWFNLNTPDLTHIISRVTDGNESFINGELKVTNAATGSTPSFFFINPSGITLGPGAFIDVPGSFYASTASSLHFSDGSQYQTNDSIITSSLSAAPPESFGFLGNEAGNLNLSGTETSQVKLTFKPGSEVGLVSNNIFIDQASINNNDMAQSGLSLQLIATGSEAKQINFTALPNQAPAGNINILDTTLDVSGNGSGSIEIRSGSFKGLHSDLIAYNTGDKSVSIDKEINLLVKEQIILEETSIYSEARKNHNKNPLLNFTKGDAGPINIQTDFLNLNKGVIKTSTPFGKGGEINIYAINMNMSGESNPDLDYFKPHIGIIKLSGLVFSRFDDEIDDIKIPNIESINSNSEENPENSGNITLLINEKLNLEGYTTISSDSGSHGKASNISVSAGEILLNANSSILSNANNTDTQDTVDNGDISIKADNLLQLNGSRINSSNSTKGKIGTITINADQAEIKESNISSSVYISNFNEKRGSKVHQEHTGNIIISINNLLNLNFSEIEANTSNPAHAGNVIVNAKEIEMHNASSISSNSSATLGSRDSGDAGNVTINAKNKLMLYDGSIISTSTQSSKGNAGKVTVHAENLEISGTIGGNGITFRKSAIESLATEAEGNGSGGKMGNGGEIEVFVPGKLKIANDAQISASTYSRGNPGKITINASQLEVSNNGQIASASFIFGDNRKNTGGNGNISINVKDNLTLDSGGSITTSTFTRGDAGKISIHANQIELVHAEISSSASIGATGKTGSLEINANQGIQLKDNSEISIENNVLQPNINSLAGEININLANSPLFLDNSSISTLSTGNAGSISVIDGSVTALHNSLITTSVIGQAGNGGNINITSDTLIMNTGFIQANTTAIQANGGTIQISEPTIIIPSSNQLQVGGKEVFSFIPSSGINVIQAIAPDGQSISPILNPPQLNLSGILAYLPIELINSSALNPNTCSVNENTSLQLVGRGGLQLRSRNFMLTTLH